MPGIFLSACDILVNKDPNIPTLLYGVYILVGGFRN